MFSLFFLLSSFFFLLGGEPEDAIFGFYCLLVCRVKEIPELFIIGRPDMTIVAFGSEVVDIFEVNDILTNKGWHLNALQRPNRWTLSLKYVYENRLLRTKY